MPDVPILPLEAALTKPQRRALLKGGGRYGTQTSAFKELQAMGLVVALPATGRVTADGRQVGAWKWGLTEAGKRRQREEVITAAEAYGDFPPDKPVYHAGWEFYRDGPDMLEVYRHEIGPVAVYSLHPDDDEDEPIGFLPASTKTLAHANEMAWLLVAALRKGYDAG